MHLSHVKVYNFKSIQELDISLGRYNPVVGYNNAGKSNFLRAISWLLKKSALPESCFHDPSKEAWVEGTVVGVSSAIHLLPENQQQQIEPFIISDQLTFRRIQKTPGTTASLVKLEVLDGSGNWRANPTGIDNALGTMLPEPVHIKAMDDAGDDVSKFAAKNTIGLLIKYALDLARANNQSAMQTVDASLAALGTHLNGQTRIPELTSLESSATQSLASLFSGIDVQIEIPPPSLDEIIKSTTIKLVEQGSNNPRAFADYGHGTQRTVQMALIQLLAKYASQVGSAGNNTVILIDEPELYLHPQAICSVAAALKDLSSGDFQIFFSTHSPMMVGADDAAETVVFWKCPQRGTTYRQKIASALSGISNSQHQTDVIYSLSHSSQWLFSEKPIIVEGKTERHLLPAVYFGATGKRLNQASASLIESAGSGGSIDIAKLFKNLGYTPKVVFDLDFAFKEAPSLNLISPADPNLNSCLQWFAANSSSLGFNLDCTGLPRKGGAMNPEKAYEQLAIALPTECRNIHNLFKPINIWLWPGGAIEAHLGIAKTNAARAQFAALAMAGGGVSHAADPQTLLDFSNWI
ncbi:ATP-dependent endonuclease [Pseudoxanthomonas koreensis]|uniref:ATP-dependent nuclease n=1 Tax=Pseudoxanthomonas koreensis TaxID=266061 RepID=UPI0035A5C177